jgi:hypothetical protein
MRKKHFVSLGAVLRDLRTAINKRSYEVHLPPYVVLDMVTEALADWCASQSVTFKRRVWLRDIHPELEVQERTVKR